MLDVTAMRGTGPLLGMQEGPPFTALTDLQLALQPAWSSPSPQSSQSSQASQSFPGTLTKKLTIIKSQLTSQRPLVG